MNAEKQGTEEDPAIFNRILETIATERICYIYKKNETRLIRIYRLPYKALIGLVNNQFQMVHTNIILESMYLNLHQGPQERQYMPFITSSGIAWLSRIPSTVGFSMPMIRTKETCFVLCYHFEPNLKCSHLVDWTEVQHGGD